MNKKITILILAVAAVLYAWQLIDYINFTIDDAFISMRVARNAALGNGFVYNVGEHVEGHSSWLWVVLLALPVKLGIVDAESTSSFFWFAKGLGIFFAIATMFALHRLTSYIFRDARGVQYYAASSVLLLAASAPFAAWSMGAMEVTCETFLLVLSLYYLSQAISQKAAFALRPITFGGIVLAALALLRPEGIMIASLIGVVFILFSPSKMRIARCIAIALPIVLVYGNFLVWRWQEYGDLFPNTFYAKTGGGFLSYVLGIKYLLGAFGALAGASFFAIPMAFERTEQTRGILALFAGFMGAVSIFIIYSGGDWMPAFRFGVPVIPAMIILAEIGFQRMTNILNGRLQKFSRHFVYAGFGVVICSVFAGRVLVRSQVPNMGSTLMSASGHALPSHAVASAWLHQHSHGKHLFACGEAGIIGFENPDLSLIDLNGLMDKHIALRMKRDESFDVDYVLDRKPDFIFLFGTQVEGRDRIFARASMKYFDALDTSLRFHNEYRLAERMMAFDIYGRK